MDLMIAILVCVVSAIGAIGGNIIASELYDTAPSLAHWLIRQAVGGLPESVQARRFEEWMGANDQYRGNVSRLGHAISCFAAGYAEGRTIRKSQREKRHILISLFRTLRTLIYVLWPIVMLFVPPAIGFAIVFFTYGTFTTSSIVLGSMSVILFLILIASFRSKVEAPTKEESTSLLHELRKHSVWQKLIAAGLALAIFGMAAFLDVGLLIGLLLFVVEIVILYLLKWIYGRGGRVRTQLPI
jgi:hypothetical protein